MGLQSDLNILCSSILGGSHKPALFCHSCYGAFNKCCSSFGLEDVGNSGRTAI